MGTWTRKELKQQGKARFKANYLMSVIAALIFFALRSGLTAATGSNATGQMDEVQSQLTSMEAADFMLAVVLFAGIFTVIELFSTVFQAFVAGPLCVGVRKFFALNRTEEHVGLKNVLYAFRCGSYMKIVGTMFLRGLFLSLWGLLFGIPALIKHYSYWMVEFIMAENPAIGYKRAFEISRQTMNGEKWNVFVFDLSFIGWAFLGFITCGLSQIFYLSPYTMASEAELYAKLREKALADRIAMPEELPGM